MSVEEASSPTHPVGDGDGAAQALRLVAGAPLLQGRTVILTGAGGGIGAATARMLAAAGALVALTDRTDALLAPVADALRDDGAKPFIRALDASDPAAFRELHRDVEGDLGPVEGLVNCAGLFTPASFDDIDSDDWALALVANLGTAVAGCRAALPAMTARGRGSIVNFASTAGEYGSVRPAAHYAAAKGGVIGLTKSLAREAGPYNVRVNAVSPGPTATAALQAATPEARAQVAGRTLLGRAGRPDELGAACVFLLSDLATFITGHVLRVNGGALL